MGSWRNPVLLWTLIGGTLPVCGSDAVTVQLALSGGVRQFDLIWRTAGRTALPAQDPITAAWNGIAVGEATIGMSVAIDRLHVRGSVTRGWIFAGDSSMTTYTDTSRSEVTSRSEQDSDHGRTGEESLALGWRWNSPDHRADLTAEVGYSRSQQHLTLTDGIQTVPATGPYTGLDSTYRADWEGPWLGLSGSWRALSSWSILAYARAQLVEYRGVLDLNLRADLAHPRSIEQKGDGYAVTVGGGIAYHLTTCTSLQALVSHEERRVADGRDRVNHLDGSSEEVPLDAVQLRAFTMTCGLVWRF